MLFFWLQACEDEGGLPLTAGAFAFDACRTGVLLENKSLGVFCLPKQQELIVEQQQELEVIEQSLLFQQNKKNGI